MIFEIQGVNFINKGAELMLYAVVDQIHNMYEDSILAISIRHGRFTDRKRANVGHLAWIDSQKLPFIGNALESTVGLIPQELRRMFRLYLAGEVDVILDASGFAYGDQRGLTNPLVMSKKYAISKKQGKKIILLPQAFGPFEDPQIRAAFIELLTHVDLLFARDPKSYEYVIELIGESRKLMRAPDFTNLVEGKVPSGFRHSGKPCIVPNYRMIDQTSRDIQSGYVPFLVKCTKFLLQKRIVPFILIHETEKDIQIAKEIRKQTGADLPIIEETNPVGIKGIIGSSSFLIGSRFHSIVSALSQNVPCLVTGWSHKYEMLLNDYNTIESIVSPIDSDDVIEAKLSQLIDPSSRSEIINRIMPHSTQQKLLSQTMWSEIKKTLS